jgi:hypothetical protein
LRCCNWIRLSIGPILEKLGGEGGKKVIPAAAGTKPGARIFVRSTSFVVAAVVDRGRGQLPRLQAEKLLRKKKNESWAIPRVVAAVCDR